MKKVYILSWLGLPVGTLAYFSTREKAEAYMKSLANGKELEITEEELDPKIKRVK